MVVVVVTGGGASAQPINASSNASEQIFIFINVSFLLIRFARAVWLC
jgi:shikimate kinase